MTVPKEIYDDIADLFYAYVEIYKRMGVRTVSAWIRQAMIEKRRNDSTVIPRKFGVPRLSQNRKMRPSTDQA